MQKPVKWILILLGLAVAGIGALVFMLFIFSTLAEDAWGPKPIANCRTGLAETEWCEGVNSSWTDCSWSFYAEGRADAQLCRRFMERRPLGTSPADYGDVDGFSVADCEGYGLSGDIRCFFGERVDFDETNRYLIAFDARCERGIVLRACNEPLRKYPRTGQRQVEPTIDAPATTADRAAAIEKARSNLRKWAAKAARVSPGQVDTRPRAGKSEWKYSELGVGAFFAMEAVAGTRWVDAPDLQPRRRRVTNVLRAFVNADGDLVSLDDRRNFAPLARALKLLDEDTDPAKAARHVAYLFGREAHLAITRSDFPSFGPDSFAPPAIKRLQERAALVFFTFKYGRTGSIETTRHELLTEADYRRAELKSEKAR